jgi:hypothetical protein
LRQRLRRRHDHVTEPLVLREFRNEFVDELHVRDSGLADCQDVNGNLGNS